MAKKGAKKRALRLLDDDARGAGLPGEWVAGLVPLPAYVPGEAGPVRPEALFWLDDRQMVVAFEAGPPGAMAAQVGDLLERAMATPMVGPPRRPARVRVASEALAGVLRRTHPSIPVAVASTPEIEDVAEAMAERMAAKEEDGPFLLEHVEPAAIASFFQAARGLYRARPWRVVPSDQDLFSVRIDALGIRDKVLVVFGQMKESFGVGWFDSLEHLEEFATMRPTDGAPPRIPPHVSLGFDTPDEVPPALRREIEENAWPLPAPDVFPCVRVVDEHSELRVPTTDELAVAEAIALALPVVVKERKALQHAWGDGPPVERTVRVDCHRGPLDVVLRAPYPKPVPVRPEHEVLGALFDCEHGDQEFDLDALRPLHKELVRQFLDSPEATEAAGGAPCHWLLDGAAAELGVTIVGLSPRDLDEFVFGVVPEGMRIEPFDATQLVETWDAFFRFLGRACGLPQAEQCRKVLGHGAAERLQAALDEEDDEDLDWLFDEVEDDLPEGPDEAERRSPASQRPAPKQPGASGPSQTPKPRKK